MTFQLLNRSTAGVNWDLKLLDCATLRKIPLKVITISDVTQVITDVTQIQLLTRMIGCDREMGLRVYPVYAQEIEWVEKL